VTAARTRSHRRGEARPAIVASARELFAARGFDGTSLRDVAQHAAVSEALLYRYFGTKAALFEESVIAPYRGFVQRFLDDWEAVDARRSNEEMVTRFVGDLYAFVVEHRDLLFALAAADRFGAPAAEGVGTLSREIRRLTDFTATEAASRGLGHVDLEMAVTSTTALVLAVGLLDDVLFTGASRPDPARLLREVSRYALGGIEQRGRAEATREAAEPPS
jgi:AcrR family transcriptional regulator